MSRFKIHKSKTGNEWFVCRVDERGICRYIAKEFKTGNAAIREFNARGRNES